MNEVSDGNRVDVVFDIYKESSIKNPEREGQRGATEATQFSEKRKARCYRGNTVQ